VREDFGRIQVAEWRRISQILFLVLFLALLVSTSLHSISAHQRHSRARTGAVFLEWNPLVALDECACHARALSCLLWSFGHFAARLCFWRFFLRLDFPMGTLQHLWANILQTKRGKQRIEANSTSPGRQLSTLC